MELTIEQALQQGIAAHKKGNLQDAERLYRAILQSQPSHPDANHNLGVLAVSVSKIDAALPLFKTALEANPKIEQFWLSYIETLIKGKQFENAKQVIEQAKRKGLTGDRLTSLETQLLPKIQKPNTTSVNPPQKLLNNLLGHYQNGRYGEAERLAVSITQDFPKHPFGWQILGATLKQKGKISEALALSQKLVQLVPQDAGAHYNLGVTLQELGRLDEAKASYTQAIALKPDFAEAHYNLGVMLQELGRLDEAGASYTQAIALKSDYVEAHYNLGNTLKELGKLDEAEASYTQAIALKSDFAEAYSNLGVTLQQLDRLEEAEASHTQALALKPDLAEAYYNLAMARQELSRLEQAISNFSFASFVAPQNPKFFVKRGLTPALLVRQPLVKRKAFMKSINDGDWKSSEIILTQVFWENPRHIKEHVEEFINLWCNFCRDLINQQAIKKLIPIFVQLLIVGEKNKDLDNLIQFLFKNSNINTVLELTEPKKRILINLGYCQYNFLAKNFPQAEFMATENIKNAESLLKDSDTEDLGWLIIRRSLALCKRKNIARNALNNLITKVTGK